MVKTLTPPIFSSKLCGNCGKDHKGKDCPIMNLQFAPTKIEFARLKEKAEKWDKHQYGIEKISPLEIHFINGQIVERLKKRIKELTDFGDHGDYEYEFLKELQEIIEGKDA